jgi:predicted transposase YbfD/YdcC
LRRHAPIVEFRSERRYRDGRRNFRPKKLCALIQAGGGKYLFSLKANHPAKLKEVIWLFARRPSKTAETLDKGHGRVEVRTLKVMDVPLYLACWDGICQLIEIKRNRWQKGKETTEKAYYITSLAPVDADPQKLMQLIRDHWKIENNLHRTRDMAFDEDRSTIRKGSSPQIMAALRNTVIQIAQKTKKPMAFVHHLGARFPKRMIKILSEN